MGLLHRVPWNCKLASMTTSPLFSGVPNSRSLGGLPLKNGGVTKDGVFYRSSSLQSITDEGLEQFSSTPIGLVADLRTPEERQMAGDKIPVADRVEMVDLAIEVGDMSPSSVHKLSGWEGKIVGMFENALPSLGDLYEKMLKDNAAQFANVASLVAQVQPDKDNAVLVHCTAGKDRTGISVALILDAVGVEREAIVANYAESQANLAGPWADGMLKRIEEMGVPIEPKLRTLVTETPPKAIETALAWVEKHHGSSAQYLKSGGLLDSQVESLKEALTRT